MLSETFALLVHLKDVIVTTQEQLERSSPITLMVTNNWPIKGQRNKRTWSDEKIFINCYFYAGNVSGQKEDFAASIMPKAQTTSPDPFELSPAGTGGTAEVSYYIII